MTAGSFGNSVSRPFGRPDYCPCGHEMDWLTDRVGVCVPCDVDAWYWDSSCLVGEHGVAIAQLASVLAAYRDGRLAVVNA